MILTTNQQKNESGFTLIELLIVILIVGVLAGLLLTVVNTAGLQSKSRDAQRKAGLERIQVALELHFADNRYYPVAANWVRIGNGSSVVETALAGGSYISAVPKDPLNTGTDSDPCNNPTMYRYNYKTDATGSYYALASIMEIATSNDSFECNILSNFTTSKIAPTCSWNATQTEVCYAVQNP